ncbi:hypothetical protein DESC_500004 [Desulfosarcina cetonica]|nr:hypothetical protein DESC_500004 [Desulfosarcina cetonica]
MQLEDIVDLGGRFEDLEAERLELIVSASHHVLGLVSGIRKTHKH